MWRILVLVAAQLFLASAHVQPGVRAMGSCADHPPAQSYHIHVLFWQTNTNSTNSALKLQDEFLANFGLTKESNTCPFEPGSTEPDAPMCVFSTDFEPAGPFLTAQTALFIPVADYQRTVSWIVPRRGSLDVFVHPNSGCSTNDHVYDGLWAGNKWEIDSSIFH